MDHGTPKTGLSQLSDSTTVQERRSPLGLGMKMSEFNTHSNRTQAMTDKSNGQVEGSEASNRIFSLTCFPTGSGFIV